MIILSSLCYSECSNILRVLIYQIYFSSIVHVYVLIYFTVPSCTTSFSGKCITCNLRLFCILFDCVEVNRYIFESQGLACTDSKVICFIKIKSLLVSLQIPLPTVEDIELESPFYIFSIVINCSLRDFQFTEILRELIIQRELSGGFLGYISLSASCTAGFIQCITNNTPRQTFCFFCDRIFVNRDVLENCRYVGSDREVNYFSTK